MVSRSKRSAAYSSTAAMPSSLCPAANIRSILAVPVSPSRIHASSPGNSGGRAPTSAWNENITWNTGWELRLRSTLSSSTSRSKGTSWWA